MSIRKSVVSGSFYPDSKEEILKYFEVFKQEKKSFETFSKIKAIIVPHAGYVFSGYTASLAYDLVKTNEEKRVILIGPSHKVRLTGASVCLYEEYETPLGNISIDKEYSKNLVDKYEYLNFYKECDFEHSTETQAPFIKHNLPNSSLVELIYGNMDYKLLSSLIDELLKDEKNLIIISTDLSHFYTQEKANSIDKYCLSGIENQDIETFSKGEACGGIGVKAVLQSSINSAFKTKVLYYCTSADAFGDKSRVVGYISAIIGSK